MATLSLAVRTVWRATLVFAILAIATLCRAAEFVFDLPDTIECRDVTPEGLCTLRPGLKVIEGKFRISARVISGNPADVIDFLYVLESDDRTLRLQGYMPNTTLESAVVDDQVEITTAKEKSQSLTLDAHVVCKPIAVGGSYASGTKDSGSSRYKQIAPKELILASGTTHREHGVFFRLQPSRTASLEGAKEFTFLATVPQTWRGDLCTISCTARAKKTSLVSTAIVPAGAAQSPIGLYLAGDAQAAAMAEQLRVAQESCAAVRAAHNKSGVFDSLSNQAVRVFSSKSFDAQRAELADAERAVIESRTRLKQLAR